MTVLCCLRSHSQQMLRLRFWKAHILLVLLCPIFSGAVNLQQCLANVTSCATTGHNCISNMSSTTALTLLRDSKGGNIVDNATANDTTIATALSYDGCKTYCGSPQEPFSWSVFSQEFSSWLLPYLALLSQLPFGARRRTDNLMSALLTLGSPTLAGYSLYVTLLNARWLNDQLLSGIGYPSAAVRQSVVQVLSSLQQVPLRIHPGRSGQFESLVVHPANDQWWLTLSEELDYSHTWSIASATSIAWVVVAYLLTVADSFSSVVDHINSNGQGTGSVWLWLLPIVVGWLVLSPKCDYDRVQEAYDKANRQVFAACSPDSDPNADPIPVTTNFGLTISPSPDWNISDRNVASPDESRIPPVFNYARVLSWSRTVYVISLYYRAARRKWNRREGFDGQPILDHVRGDAPQECRMGNRDQITRYCHPGHREYTGANVLWPRGVFFNMVVASLMSLQLQWATTSAAVLVVWYTPTIGLGCRSLAYLIYGALSTAVWMLLVLSSALGYYAHHLMNNLPTPDLESSGQHTPASSSRIPVSTTMTTSVVYDDPSASIPLQEVKAATIEVEEVMVPSVDAGDARLAQRISHLADWLRWIGKSLAIVNAIGIIANSVFQYAGVYDTCFCDSSVFGWGRLAFNIIAPNHQDIVLATSAWIGAVALALVSCGFFVGTIYIMRDSLPS